MSASIASGPVLLNRILTLRESSPFILTLDTILQSSFSFTKELIYKVRSTNLPVKVILVSFESKKAHFPVDDFIDALNVSFDRLIKKLEGSISKFPNAQKLIIFNSLNYVRTIQQVSILMRKLMNPTITIYGTFHLDIPIPRSIQFSNGPTTLMLLRYVANTILELIPATLKNKKPDEFFDIMSGIDIPITECNRRLYECTLIYKRKSGRAMTYQILIDTIKHTYKRVEKESGDKQSNSQEEEKLLNNLTTFNLSTTREQRAAREKVELPFMEAQKSLGSIAGSTVYEFDKDDDYDDDDDADNPYEDPM